jgi:hypothetical protein
MDCVRNEPQSYPVIDQVRCGIEQEFNLQRERKGTYLENRYQAWYKGINRKVHGKNGAFELKESVKFHNDIFGAIYV